MDDFPLAPPLEGDWVTMDDDTSALLGARLVDFEAVPRSQTIGAIRVLPCPCYAEYVLCDAVLGKPGPDQAMMSFLYGRDGVWRLTGNSEVIHMANANHAPDLSTPALQAFYLRFFCFFVHGAEGPFEIVSDSDSLVPGDFEASAVQPPKKDEETGYWATTVLYGRSLFRAEFEIEDGGQVRMENDDVIAEEVTRRPELVFEDALRRLRQEDK